MKQEIGVLRELGKAVAEAAALDINGETVRLWKCLNTLRPVRPMIMLDQLPWNELNVNDELTLRCQDPFLRSLEWQLRERLYKFRHFRGDMVMHDRVEIPKTVRVETGVHVHETTLATDPTSGVVSHQFEDQIPDDAALERIPMPKVIVDEAADRRNLALAGEIFEGILPVRPVGPAWGYGVHAGVWDTITSLRGAERVLYDIIDRPDFSFRMVSKFAAMFSHTVDQYEALGLLDVGAPGVHCTGAYTDELPSADYHGGRAQARDVCVFGLAQVFSTISPEMHDVFEIQPMKPHLERFGLAYYGCCDPLDRKIHIVRKIRNVRKISASPWADPERTAEQIGRDFVLSAKPNPAFLATDRFDEARVRRELRHIVAACRTHGTPCELILKDVSTVRYEPQRLVAWERIAREVATEG